MVNCFNCAFCKRNGDKNPHIRKDACYCDCPGFFDVEDDAKYCRVSTHTKCSYWTDSTTCKKRGNDMNPKERINDALRNADWRKLEKENLSLEAEILRLKKLLYVIREIVSKGLDDGFGMTNSQFKEILESL